MVLDRLRERRVQRGLIFLATFVTCMLGMFMVRGQWQGAWGQTAAQASALIGLVGPVAMVVAAAYGIGWARSGRRVIAKTSSRRPSMVHLREIVDAGAPLVAAMILAALIASVLTGASHPYRNPGIVVMLVLPSLVTLAALIALAWTIGVLVPNVVVPVALFFVYPVASYRAAMAAGQNWPSLNAGSGGWSFGEYLPAWQLPVLQIVCFGALFACVVFAVSRAWFPAFVSVAVVAASVAMLLSIPEERTIYRDTRAYQPVCTSETPIICLTRLHANQLPRLAATLEPLANLIAARWPAGVVFVENGTDPPDTVADGKQVVSVDLWTGEGGGAAHFSRDQTLAMMAHDLLGSPLQCPLWDATSIQAGVRTLGGEVMVWFGKRYDVDIRSIGGGLELPTYVTSNGLATTLGSRSDPVVITWLTSRKVQAALRTCGAADSVSAPEPG